MAGGGTVLGTVGRQEEEAIVQEEQHDEVFFSADEEDDGPAHLNGDEDELGAERAERRRARLGEVVGGFRRLLAATARARAAADAVEELSTDAAAEWRRRRAEEDERRERAIACGSRPGHPPKPPHAAYRGEPAKRTHTDPAATTVGAVRGLKHVL